MKKILVFNFSPRKDGNCKALTQAMAGELSAAGVDVAVYDIAAITVNGCKACGACKKKNVPGCVQKDDFAALIPDLDAADGIVFAAPIYFGRVPGTAKNFVDRLYCYFNPAVGPMFTKKDVKKLAVVLTYGGGPAGAYDPEVGWLEHCFGVLGVTETKGLLSGGLNGLWQEGAPHSEALLAEAGALARWVAE